MSDSSLSRGPGRAARALRRGVQATLGSWSPPPWLRWTVRGARRRPLALVALAALSVSGWIGWQKWLAWQEAHRPRPLVDELTAIRKLTPSINPPSVPTVTADDEVTRTTLSVRFNEAAAPLDAVDGPAAGFALEPEVAGAWVWSDEHGVTFTPVTPWPAGETYLVRIDPAKLAPHTSLAVREVLFATPPIEALVERAEFQTDQADPAKHQAVVSFHVNYPTDRDAFTARLEVGVVGGSPVFTKDGRLTADVPSIEVIPDQHQPAHRFHVRTAAISPPEKTDFAKMTLAAGLIGRTGGQGTKDAVDGRVALPTRDTGFGIETARTLIVPRDGGEPQQMLTLTTKGYAPPAKFAEAVEAHLLPPKIDGEGNAVEWTGAAEVTADVLAKARRVPLTAVPPEAPITATHAFEFAVSEPGTLLVRMPAGFQALGGFVLGKTFSQLVTVPEIPRELGLVGKGGVLALNGEKKLSVKTRGVEALRFTLARVPPAAINHLVSQTRGDFSSPAFRGAFSEDNIARLSVTTQPVAMRTPYEACWSTYDFAAALQAPDPLDPDASRGLFFLDVDEAPDAEAESDGNQDEDDESGLRDRRFVLVTDLGLIVKTNGDDSREVFVQSIQEGGPVVGVQITAVAVNGDRLADALTDAEGHATLPSLSHLQREKRPVAVLARRGNDVAFLPWNRSDRKIDFSNFDTGGVQSSAGDSLSAFVFAERGVYRPGESMHLGCVVRRMDWQPLPEALPLTMELRDAEEQLVASTKLAVGADGLAETRFDVALTRRTGIYTARVLVPGDNQSDTRPIGRLRVRIEDFQPDRMKLTPALSRTSPGWIAPTDVKATVQLDTLFGIAAEGRRITGLMRLTPTRSAFPAFPGYDFRLWTGRGVEPAQREISLGEVNTDAAGRASFDLQLERFSAASFDAEIELEAFEPDGGRSVRALFGTRVSPLPYAVGWKADGPLHWIARDLPMVLHLVATSPQMKATIVDGLTRRVIETKHVSVLSKRPDGGYAYVSTEKEETVETAALTLPEAGTDVALLTTRPGRFRMEVTNAGGQLVCAVGWQVVGSGDASRTLEKNAELELSLPSVRWKTGESVDFNVRAPFTGAGLVTFERDRVLGWKWFRGGSTSFAGQIPVPDSLEGSAYVNVALVRGLDSPEIFTSPLSYGVAPVFVEPTRRKLPLELDVPGTVRPGETLRIGYRTTKPARVVLWAVDEGIHRVTDYTLPQPLEHFFRKCALEVETSQLADQIMPEFTLLSRAKAFGGDGDAEELLKLGLNPFQRKREVPAVFWSGLVEAGADRREVAYQVPDYFSGRLAVMGLVVTADALGVAETGAVCRGPFVLTPNAPAFVAPGDEFTTSLTVANTLETNVPASVTATAALTGSLELVEGPAAPVEVAPGREATVRFRLRAGREPGPAEIAFTVAGAGESVVRRATLSVRPAAPFMTHVRSGYFRQQSFDLPVERDLLTAFAERKAAASPLPLGLTTGLAKYLEKYPYGCSEQITSQSMSRLLALDDTAPRELKSEARRQLEHTFSVLHARQAAHGGFGYWDARGAAAGIDWLSVYVAHFLAEARQAGVEPPVAMADALQSRLRKMVAEPVTSRSAAATEAHAIYLLTRGGEVTTNYVLNLRDQLDSRFKDDWHGDLTGAWLAATYALLQQADEARTLLQKHRAAALTQRAKRPAWAAYYESDLAFEAQSLLVVCTHFPALVPEIGYDQLKPLLDPLDRGSFNTVGSAWAILALRAYSAMQADTGVKAGLSMLPRDGGPAAMLAPPAAGLLTAPFPALAKVVRFERLRSDGAPDLGLFYQLVEAGFDAAVPAESVSDGLEVAQRLEPPPGALKVGEGVAMTLRVRNLTNRTLTHLAALNLLPGGFEIEHESLKPGPDAVPGAEYVDVREDRNIFFFSLQPTDSVTFRFRVKPTCAGRFTVPPGFAESMYIRELKARGRGDVIEVQSRE